MLTIMNKEFKSYFTSPIGYVFMCFFLLVFGLYFTGINIFGQNGNYTYVLSSLTSLLLFTIPILTMRLLSEERKNKTDQLLLTAPVHVYDIVVGKFLSAALLLAVTLLVTFIQPLLLMTVGNVPVATILGAYIGFFLLGCTLIAIGLFVSALTESQITAAIGTIGLFLVLLLADSITQLIPATRKSALCFVGCIIVIIALLLYNSVKDLTISVGVGIVGLGATLAIYFLKAELFDGLPTKILQWFSIFSRYENFSNGLLDLGAIIYYLSFIGIFLFLTNQVIQKRSWS